MKYIVYFEKFFDNSSSRDAFFDYISGYITLRKLKDYCWAYDCKQEVSKLITIQKTYGKKNVRKRCVQAINKRGFTVGDII